MDTPAPNPTPRPSSRPAKRLPGIPVVEKPDNPLTSWAPLIAVAFVAVAFVSGLIGYVVRAPQAEMARLNKALNEAGK